MPPDRFPGPLWDVLSARVPGVRARVTQDLCVSVYVCECNVNNLTATLYVLGGSSNNKHSRLGMSMKTH